MTQDGQSEMDKFSSLLLVEVSNKILAFHPPSLDTVDTPIWTLTSSEKFTLNLIMDRLNSDSFSKINHQINWSCVWNW